jgi:hypothetical protein
MPFKSAKQERYMFMFHPDIAKRWVERYGHAPGYLKSIQRRRKSRGKKKKS